MKALVSEIHARPKYPLGMPPSLFLRDYWQKCPLLIRGFFTDFQNPLTPNDLAGLACEPAALSRLVIHYTRRDRWTLRNGPMQEGDFGKLGKRDWSLLVQDVDKWDVSVASLLERFDFIPSWRLDDVMVSYATDRGGVGAHVDHYDVFLIQGLGQRRWRIDASANPPLAFRDDAPLKLLREFNATHDWILEPGDALYLPPGVPHEGVAIGECMTYSVGMRAPSQAEMLLDFAEFVAEPLAEEQRFSDADLTQMADGNEIDDDTIKRVRRALPHFGNMDNSTLAHWFGCFMTRYRAAHEAAPRARPLSTANITRQLKKNDVMRNPWSRVAWHRNGKAAEFFVSGESHACPIALAKLLCQREDIPGDTLTRLVTNAKAMTTLTNVINAGHFQFVGRR